MTHLELVGPYLRATLSTVGAELQSLRGPDGREYLWQAGPEWPQHAPVLFPVIGRVPSDRIVIDGHSYPMNKHGFARHHEFVAENVEDTRVVLSLTSSAATHQHYPFDFRLQVSYDVSGPALHVAFTVTNPGQQPLPYALGWHPAFRWPMDPGAERAAHHIAFSEPEHAPTRRVTDVLLRPELFPNPVRGRRLTLTDAHFQDGALILEDLHSRSVTYTAPEGRALTLSWDGFDHLALWSPLDAGLLCLEPWTGLPAGLHWQGEFSSMPALRHIAPGEDVRYPLMVHPSTHSIRS